MSEIKAAQPDGRPWSVYQPPSKVFNQSYPAHSQGVLQMSNMTKAERFPLIFNSAVELKPDAKRIMSFGCSTGEECEAIASRFPEAEIVGIDIDYYTLQRARKKNTNPKIFFHDNLGATGKYDLALALMVLFQIDAPIKLEPWESSIVEIDKHLNIDAVFMLYTSEFNFLESSVSKKYKIIREWTRRHNRKEDKEYFCGYYRKVE